MTDSALSWINTCLIGVSAETYLIAYLWLMRIGVIKNKKGEPLEPTFSRVIVWEKNSQSLMAFPIYNNHSQTIITLIKSNLSHGMSQPLGMNKLGYGRRIRHRYGLL